MTTWKTLLIGGSDRTRGGGRCGVIWCVCLFVVCLSGKATAGQGDLLESWSWSELSHGVSIRPLAGAKLVEGGGGERVLEMKAAAGYRVEVLFKDNPAELPLPRLLNEAIHQFGGAQPSAVILEQRIDDVGAHRVGVVYFKAPGTAARPEVWVEGQAFCRVGDRSIAMLRLDAYGADPQEARSGFDALLSSIKVGDPKELQRQRARQVGRGVAWRKRLGKGSMHGVLVPEQWFRIVEGGRDVGYQRMTQDVVTRLGVPGVQVEVQTRLTKDGRAFDSISEYFLSDEGSNEVWSIRTTLRPVGTDAASGRVAGRGTPATVSWAETGVRTNDLITVSRQTPSGVQDLQWRAPERGYLSLVEGLLLERLLVAHPPAEDSELGFYAYQPDSKKVALGTVRLEQGGAGSAVAHRRATLVSGVQVSRYDREGRLAVRHFADGREVYPATRGQIVARGGLR